MTRTTTSQHSSLGFCVNPVTSAQMDKSQSPLSKSSTPSPSHREALTPGAAGPSTSCLRLVSKAASSADPLGEQNATIGWVPGRRWCLSAPPPLLLPLLQALLALPLSSLPSSPQSHVCAPRFIPGSFWRGVARRAERRAGQPGRLRRRSDSVPANQRRGQRLLAQPHGEATPPPPPAQKPRGSAAESLAACSRTSFHTVDNARFQCGSAFSTRWRMTLGLT